MVFLNGHVLKWWLVFGLLACGSVHAVAQESKWVSIGPASIETGSGNWWNGSGFGTGPVTGRVADIAVDPSNPAHWLIGGGYGGVWETTDMGRTWAPRSDDAPTQAMGVIAFAPSNPQIVYAGTGEGGSGFNCAGAGLLRSTDGGTTWLHRTPQLTNQSFSDLLVDPKDPNHLVAATSWGYMCGRVGGWLGGKSSQFAPTPGLWASRNGGLPVGFPNGFVRVMEGWATDLEVDPGDFQRQYAGIGNPYGKDPRNGVFRSFDGGDTWTEVVSDTTTWKECPPARCPGYMNPNVKPGGQGRVELAIAPSNPNVLYAIIQDALDNNGNDAQILGIWRTTNAWDTYPVWQEIPLPLNWVGSLGRQTEYDLAIIVDPTDENIIYVGGTDLYRFSQGSWAKVAGYSMERIHVDIQSMAWVGSRLLVTSDGGVFSTQDSGNTWGNHNNGLTLTQFTHGSVHPTDSSIVMGGSQDNGSEVGTGQPPVWRLVYGGDGGDNAISPTRPTTHWAGSAQNLAIFRTTDGGSNVSDATSGIDRSGVDEGLDKPFEKCPANEDVFIAGNDRLWRTSNFFSAPAPQWVDNGPSATIGERNISALAFAFSDRSCGTYAFSRWDGAIYLTTSSGTNWKRIDQPCNGCITTVLAFQPNNPDIVYAANFPPGFKVTLNPEAPLIFTGPILYKTVNATSSTPIWSDISPPARTGLNTMIIDSRNPATVYVGDGRDVWRSTDGGLNWVSIGGPTNGLPRVFISDLQINASGQLFAFTFGRGAYRLETGNVPDSAAISAVLPANASKTESLLVAGIGVIVLVGRRRMQWHSGTAP